MGKMDVVTSAKGNPGNEKFRTPNWNSDINGTCDECGAKYWLGGPIYNGPLYCQGFLDAVRHQAFLAPDERNASLQYITTWGKLQAVTQAMHEEIEVPLYYHLAMLFSKFKVQTPPLRQFKGALRRLGYEVSHFNREPQAIKTNAPNVVVFDLVRAWAKENPPNSKKISDFAQRVFDRPITTEGKIDFTQLSDMRGGSTLPNGQYVEHVPMFLPNPEKCWGPKKAAAIKRTNPDSPDQEKKTARTEATVEA